MKQQKSRKPYFKRFSGFFIMHFLFGCYREISNCAKSLKGAILRHFYIKSFCLVTTVCTVDFEIPNFFAVILTVALFSIMYSASLTVLSSMCSFKIIPPPKYCYLSVCTRRRKKYVLSRFAKL